MLCVLRPGKTKIKSAYLNLQQANRHSLSPLFPLFLTPTVFQQILIFPARLLNTIHTLWTTVSMSQSSRWLTHSLHLYFMSQSLFRPFPISVVVTTGRRNKEPDPAKLCSRKKNKKKNNPWLPQLTLWVFEPLPTLCLSLSLSLYSLFLSHSAAITLFHERFSSLSCISALLSSTINVRLFYYMNFIILHAVIKETYWKIE